jgi:GxxExxY protein
MTPNEVSKVVVDSAMKVHTALGAGLLKEAYKACLKHELQKRKMDVLSEVALPIVYDGMTLNS